MRLSRRSMLGGLGGLMLGGAVAGALGGVASAAEKKESVKAPTPGEVARFAQVGGDFSWKPHRLDLDEVAHVAHAGYHHKGYG